MEKRLFNLLFSTRLTAILFIVFAVAMATGTILDRHMDTSPTPYTRQLIYNAWWFEAIMVFFVINFVGNIFRYRLHKKEKWATLILHLAFIFILLGAFITRYIGYEGMLSIREGATEQQFLSQKTYITGRIVGDYKIDGQLVQKKISAEVDFSPRLNNSFNKTIIYGNTEVNIKLEKFVTGAEKDIIPNKLGNSYLKVVEAANGSPHNHFLKNGTVSSLHNVLISLNKYQEGAINITQTENGLFIKSPFKGEYMTMATGTTGKLVKDSLQPLILRSRYIIGNMQIVFPKPIVKGKFGLVKKPNILRGDENGIILNVTANGETKQVNLLGGQYIDNGFEIVKIGGLDIELRYGSKILDLPFKIKLNDFIAERYPGSQFGYSSYESRVTIIDKDNGDYDYRIYMNNVLDHKEYRFFQADFHKPDEKGSIFSISHDRWGTYITYTGYMLLYFGLMAILLARNTRFDSIRKRLNKLKDKKAKLLTAIILMLSFMGFAQHSDNDEHKHAQKPKKVQIDSILKQHITPKTHADKFGELVIQDLSGRMMPMDTYASELLRKLSKKDTYEGLSANQIALSIIESPTFWYNVPVIYLTPRKADSIRTIIGIPKEQKYVALIDFFSQDLSYKLAPYLDDATTAQIPNGFQSEVIKVNQKMNLLSNAIEGRSLKIFPIPNDENSTWVSTFEYKSDKKYKALIKDSAYSNLVIKGVSSYLNDIYKAKKTGDFSSAENVLKIISEVQKKIGGDVMLSDDEIKTEILYNKYDIFKKLFSWYMYVATVLFILMIVQIFKYRSKPLKLVIKVLIGILIALFVLHTAGLVVRWYISGHAPWSDAYESLIYVAWSVMLFGFLLGKKNNLTIAASAFVASMILMIAHWNWMDPSIANLQPVLQGFWLMIHVSVIVGSYGPFAIGTILGFVTLILMIFTTKENKERIFINIKELTIINEMALTVGLVMLTIGNFLGGMWANESWGRYWGWDPKETWALISIMIYAFVIHMRLVPGLRGRWFYNLMSILAFGSILMTYFGVNFYLSGLHSYASGDQIISFQVIAIALVIVALLGVLSYWKYKKYYKK